MVKPVIFLDRDGVINHSKVVDGKAYAPRAMEDFELLPNVEMAIQNLAGAGFQIFVVTNQPDIGNGLVDAAVVDQMHQQLFDTLPITKVYMCPHKQTEGCDCRKPNPGMLLQAKKEFEIDLSQSFMIGDRYSDMQAGEAVGCKTIFIDHNYVETPDFDASFRCNNLLEASKFILQDL